MNDVPVARHVDNPVPFCRFAAFPPHCGRIFRDRPRRATRRESNPSGRTKKLFTDFAVKSFYLY